MVSHSRYENRWTRWRPSGWRERDDTSVGENETDRVDTSVEDKLEEGRIGSWAITSKVGVPI